MVTRFMMIHLPPLMRDMKLEQRYARFKSQILVDSQPR